jgi:hypothetical protein
MSLTRFNAASRDCAMPYGEVDHGKRFFSSRGCAETSIDGPPSTPGGSLTLSGAQSESSKRSDTMCAETAEACPTLQNNGRRGIAFRRGDAVGAQEDGPGDVGAAGAGALWVATRSSSSFRARAGGCERIASARCRESPTKRWRGAVNSWRSRCGTSSSGRTAPATR